MAYADGRALDGLQSVVAPVGNVRLREPVQGDARQLACYPGKPDDFPAMAFVRGRYLIRVPRQGILDGLELPSPAGLFGL